MIRKLTKVVFFASFAVFLLGSVKLYRESPTGSVKINSLKKPAHMRPVWRVDLKLERANSKAKLRRWR